MKPIQLMHSTQLTHFMMSGKRRRVLGRTRRKKDNCCYHVVIVLSCYHVVIMITSDWDRDYDQSCTVTMTILWLWPLLWYTRTKTRTKTLKIMRQLCDISIFNWNQNWLRILNKQNHSEFGRLPLGESHRNDVQRKGQIFASVWLVLAMPQDDCWENSTA